MPHVQAAPVGGYDSWATHKETAGGGPGTIASASGPESAMTIRTETDRDGMTVEVLADQDGMPNNAGQQFEAHFRVVGRPFEAGTSYSAANGGFVTADVGDRVCAYGDYWAPEVREIGSFHVHEIEFGPGGAVTRFSATYELNCQDLGGPLGHQGSVAVNATAPAAPVPAPSVTPPPVGKLVAANLSEGVPWQTITTLTWALPAGAQDATVDMVHSADRSRLPALIARSPFLIYRGAGTSWTDPDLVPSMDTRTYRVVPRSATGRLGPASFVTVRGSRFNSQQMTETITYGQEMTFTGRITQAWGSDDDEGHHGANAFSGPALGGEVVVLCQRDITSTWSVCNEADRGRTDADGRFRLSAKPLENSVYDVRLPTTPTLLGNDTRVANAYVAPQTDLRIRAVKRARAASEPRRGSTVHFTTSRARAGTRGILLLQRYDGKRWRTVITKKLPRGQGSRVAISHRETKAGLHRYRVVKPADARHVHGYSRVVRLRLR